MSEYLKRLVRWHAVSDDHIRRGEFDALRGEVREIDRRVAAQGADITTTKADVEEIMRDQKSTLDEIRAARQEMRDNRSVRGIVTGGWAAGGVGLAWGALKLMGLVH